MNHIITLILIVLVAALHSLYSGYLNEWRIFRTHLDDFLHPITAIQLFILNGGFVLIPVSFVCWMLWVGGTQKIFRRAGLFIGLFTLFMLAYFLVVFLSTFLFFDILKWGGSNFDRDLACWFVFLLLTPIWNNFLARVEGVRLKPRQLYVLFAVGCFVPFYCCVWSRFLSVFINGEFVSNSFSNGGLVSSLILYQGMYFLWLKSRKKLNPAVIC